MIGSGKAIADLVERLDGLTAGPAAHDVDVMLARYRRDVPDAVAVTAADNLYYDQVIKNEQYDVDARAVREYFRYETVKPGVLGVVSRLFGITLEPVDVPTWHHDVEVYDVTDDGRAIGRVYLDMHPRPGKFNHAAQFSLVPGITGRFLPEGVARVQLPDRPHGARRRADVLPRAGSPGARGARRAPVLGDVLGRRHGVGLRRGTEPAARGVGLGRGRARSFATNTAGEPIPAALVEAMKRADAFGRGAWTRRQLNYTALSYGLHADPPADLATFTAEVDAHFGPYTPIAGTHQYAGFGHLDGYGSAYYTYLWSLIIAKDLRTAFTAGLMDPGVGRRYRESILEPGGSADAADLVERFLGRPSSFDAFEAWLAEGTRV